MTEQRTFIPQKGERGFTAGQTGSGKTAFAQFLMMRMETAPIFIYDTKIEPKFDLMPNNKVVHDMVDAHKEYDNPELDYIIVRPHEYLLDKPFELDKMLYYHYTHFHNSGAYIDEAFSFHTASGRAGAGLMALYTRGRSKGITTILSTQRPKFISNICITEAQKLYIFKLALKSDRQKIGEVIPDFADYPLPPKHGFYYFDGEDDKAKLFEPIKLDPKLDTGYTDQTDIETKPDTISEHILSHDPGTKHVWI